MITITVAICLNSKKHATDTVIVSIRTCLSTVNGIPYTIFLYYIIIATEFSPLETPKINIAVFMRILHRCSNIINIPVYDVSLVVEKIFTFMEKRHIKTELLNKI